MCILIVLLALLVSGVMLITGMYVSGFLHYVREEMLQLREMSERAIHIIDLERKAAEEDEEFNQHF